MIDTNTRNYGTSDTVSSNDNDTLHISKTAKSFGAEPGASSIDVVTRQPEVTASTLGAAGGAGATEGNPYQPLLRHSDVATRELMTSELLRHSDVPRELLTSLTPEELRLNMNPTDAPSDSDEQLLFEAKRS